MRGSIAALALGLLAGCPTHRLSEALPPPPPVSAPASASAAEFSAHRAAGPPALVAAWGQAGLPDRALEEARAAARAAPEDPEALIAWVRATRAAGTDWSLAAELAALGDGPLPSLVRAWAAALAAPVDPAAQAELAAAATALPGTGPLLQAEALLAAGDARAAARVLEGCTEPDAIRLSVRALVAAREPHRAARRILEAIRRDPGRPDVAVGLWGRGLNPRALRPARRAAVKAALAALRSADPIRTHHAWEVLARAGHPAAAEAAARLAHLVPGLVLPPRMPYGATMIRHLGEAAAKGGGPLPADLTPVERAGVHRAEARWRSRAGLPRAAEAWDLACADEEPRCLLDAAEALLSREPSAAAGFAGRALAAVDRVPPRADPVVDAALRARILAADTRAREALEPRRDTEPENPVLASDPALRARQLEEFGAREAALAAWAQAGVAGHPDADAALARLYVGPASPAALLEAVRARQGVFPSRAAITAAMLPPPGSPEAILSAARLATDTGTLALSDLGGQTVVIAFWASWCAPCKEELPALARAAAAWRADGLGVRVLAVSVDDREGEYQAGRRRFGVEGLTVARAPDLAASLGIRAIPSTWVLGPSGRVEWEVRGYGPDGIGDLDREVRRLASPGR